LASAPKARSLIDGDVRLCEAQPLLAREVPAQVFENCERAFGLENPARARLREAVDKDER